MKRRDTLALKGAENPIQKVWDEGEWDPWCSLALSSLLGWALLPPPQYPGAGGKFTFPLAAWVAASGCRTHLAAAHLPGLCLGETLLH